MHRSKTTIWSSFIAVCAVCVMPTVVVSQSSAALRSCHGVDFEAGDDTPYIIFSSHSYPAVDAKMNQDFGTERLDDLVAIGQFASLAVNDMFVPALTLPCSHETYDATGCRMNFLFGGAAKVEAVSLVGERLSYNLIDEDDGVVNTIVVGNRSYDSLTLASTNDSGTTTSAWNRAGDGTETYAGDSGDGNVVSYTERSDCSGEAYIAQAEGGAVKATTELSWTSTTAADFTLTYTMCNYVDGTECVSGAF